MPILGSLAGGAAKGFGATAGAAAKIKAIGGCISICGDYKIHTFTGPGTFEVQAIAADVPAPQQAIDYVVIGGGGGSWGGRGGGGGAGGFRESHNATVSGCYTASPKAVATSIPISVSSYPITIGGGGTNSINTAPPTSGFGITSTGGGRGEGNPWLTPGHPGGSGGGAGGEGGGGGGSGGSGNAGGYSPPEGNPGAGGNTTNNGPFSGSGGGGGGATEAGQIGPNGIFCGRGGTGAGTNISPSGGVQNDPSPYATPGVRYYAGGGGGTGQIAPCNFGCHGAGGGGGLYAPGCGPSHVGQGVANTGGGGSGFGQGGAGVVIVRYKYK